MKGNTIRDENDFRRHFIQFHRIPRIAGVAQRSLLIVGDALGYHVANTFIRACIIKRVDSSVEYRT